MKKKTKPARQSASPSSLAPVPGKVVLENIPPVLPGETVLIRSDLSRGMSGTVLESPVAVAAWTDPGNLNGAVVKIETAPDRPTLIGRELIFYFKNLTVFG